VKRASRVAPTKVAKAWQNIAASDDGQLIIADLFLHCGIYRPHDMDNLQFCEGQRNVALMVAAYLGYRPDDFVQEWKRTQEVMNVFGS
jgi:hypothetical protein